MESLSKLFGARIQLIKKHYYLVYYKPIGAGQHKPVTKECINKRTFQTLLASNHIELSGFSNNIWIVSSYYRKYLGNKNECIESV